MLAAEAVPALIFLALLVPIPESPRWLIQAGREEEARGTLERIGGPEYAEAEIAAVKEVLQEEEGSFAELFSPTYRLPLGIAVVLMVGSQFSGINVIMYYSTEIFRNATGDTNAAFKCSVWIGLINLIATFVAIAFVDKAGRRPLLLLGNAIQAVALLSVGFIYARNPHSAGSWALLFFIQPPLPWPWDHCRGSSAQRFSRPSCAGGPCRSPHFASGRPAWS